MKDLIDSKIQDLEEHEPEGSKEWKEKVDKEIKAQIEILEELKQEV